MYCMRVCVCVYVYLDVSLMRDVLQDDGLHGEDVGKLHLGDVERTHDMGPTCQREGNRNFFYSGRGNEKVPLLLQRHGGARTTSTVGPLEGTVFVGTKLTPLRQEGEGNSVNKRVRVLCSCIPLRGCVDVLTTRAARSCDSHFRQNQGPVGTCTMP